MIDFAKHRAKLLARIASNHQQKLEVLPTNKEPCAHNWQRYRETLNSDNIRFKGRAYFVVIACDKCETKRRTELITEI